MLMCNSNSWPHISITQCIGVLEILKKYSVCIQFQDHWFNVLHKIEELPESFISSSEATFTLISWLSKLFLAMGLPSLGFSGPGGSVAAAVPVGPSWQKVAGKLGWTWLWDWEDGLGLNASSTLGSSFRWNGDLSASLWLAAVARK